MGVVVPGYTNVGLASRAAWHKGDWLLAQVVVTNQSLVTLRYIIGQGEPYGWVRAKTATGWTNGHLTPPLGGSYPFVRPGSNAIFTAWLPTGTVQWQFGVRLRTASVRERAPLRFFELGWWDRPVGDVGRFFRWSFRLLPDMRGAEQELESDLFEVGVRQSNEAPGVDGAIPSVLHAGRAPPAATERPR